MEASEQHEDDPLLRRMYTAAVSGFLRRPQGRGFRTVAQPGEPTLLARNTTGDRILAVVVVVRFPLVVFLRFTQNGAPPAFFSRDGALENDGQQTTATLFPKSGIPFLLKPGEQIMVNPIAFAVLMSVFSETF